MVAASMMPMLGRRLSPHEEVRRLEAIIRTCPAYYPALFHLGVLRAAAARIDAGRRLLLQGADRMAEREPSAKADVQAIGGMIDSLEESLRYDLARDLLERLTEHYPSEPYFHDELGAAFVFLGETDAAIRRFRKAVALAPKNARYHCNLGWGYLVAGRLGEAETQLRRATGIRPDDEVTLGNQEILRFLQRQGGTFEDYLLRPLDRTELDRLEKKCERRGDFADLDRTANQWNYDRLEAWKWELCRRRDLPSYPEVYKSLRAFFRFFQELSEDTYTLYEDMDRLGPRFRPLMHKFIFKMADADADIIEEIYVGLLSFYGHLAERGVLGKSRFAEFRSRIVGMKPSIIDKAKRYAEIRHDGSISEEEKERIRDELFDGDHLWPGI